MRMPHPGAPMAAFIWLGLLSLLISCPVPRAQAFYRIQDKAIPKLAPSYREDDSYSYTRQLERDKAEQQFLGWTKSCEMRYTKYKEMKSRSLDHQTSDTTIPQVIVVDKLGLGNSYMTVQAAVDSIATPNKDRVIIQVNPGVYREKVFISKHKRFITIQGAGREETRIEWNSTASDTDTGHYNKNGTFASASFGVEADFFIAKDISFWNTAPVALPGAVGGQAVAFRISGDQSALYNCGFHGGQDTLYDHRGRHYFQDCYITGTVDYIFGDALSMYKNCTIESTGPGAVTAQKRSNDTAYSGFSIVDSRITGVGPSYLGRAWGNYSRVVFSRCFIDVNVIPGGWNDWEDPTRQWKVFYGQYECSGSGANLTSRVSWSHELTTPEAQPFLSVSFIDGQEWLPNS